MILDQHGITTVNFFLMKLSKLATIYHYIYIWVTIYVAPFEVVLRITPLYRTF